MSRIKVIVNPQAGRGYAGRVSAHIAEAFRKLGADFELVHTRYAGQAIELAKQAIDQGYDTLVAVGGDGTAHEVINGMMARGNGQAAGTLGCVPAGSGNDFSMMNAAPRDIEAACSLIAQGATRQIDVGRVTIDGEMERYFDNAVGIGFDGLVVHETNKLKNLRGLALYIPAVLRTIFGSLTSPAVKIALDGKTLEGETMMLVTCNGPREGGTFYLAPEARYDDGLFDIVFTERMSRLQMLALVPSFIKGTHLKHPKISLHHARKIEITSEEPLYFHVDGEILCDHAHEIKIEIVPHSLRMIAPHELADEAD